MNKRASVLKWLLGPLISIVSLVVFFGGVELFLNGINAGYSSRFYRVEKDENGTKIYRENREFTHPYFEERLMRKPQPFRLDFEKKENEIRIFVMGSSAAMGDPEASFSFSRFLEVMFEEAYPQNEIEAVNAAMTAINSHTVARVARDCVRLKPDAFVIYEGNNEVIGPFGPVGVLTGYFRNKNQIDLQISLRESRMGQLLRSILLNRSAEGVSDEKWGGMEMFLEQRIALGNSVLERVYDLFEANLEDIVRRADTEAVPSFLCTILTNERDFAPFSSQVSGDSDIPENIQSLIEDGDQLLGKNKLDDALAVFLKAWKESQDHAELAFRIGRIYLQLGDFSNAKRFLVKARDLDTLRFRTDSALNQRIRETAETSENAFLVDLAEAFARASKDGLIGDEWLYEHVHLNAYANYQIANVLFAAISKQLVSTGKLIGSREHKLSFSDASKLLGYTLYEQALIAGEMVERFKRPPFTFQMDHAIRLSSWETRFSRIREVLGSENAKTDILSIYNEALGKRPDDWMLCRNYGMALLAFEENEAAHKYLEKAFKYIPDDPDTLFSLATVSSRLGQNGSLSKYLEKLRKLEPRYPGLEHFDEFSD
ncbi:MAG: tetratricopeptide repeat protein [Opitutales bacterium]|nr:tetratricopeptide repeat protein [Opitutales bacterium]